MGLETFSYITSLNVSNPVGASDAVSEGDDHIRGLKVVLTNSFGQIAGAVTLTHTQINNAAIKTEANTFTDTVTIDGGVQIKALKVNVAGVNARSSLSLRPERVFLNPAEGRIENVFDGVVEELIYLGDHIRTRVNVCGNDEFVVKVPNSQDHRMLKKGQPIRVGWSSDDCRALDPLE